MPIGARNPQTQPGPGDPGGTVWVPGASDPGPGLVPGGFSPAPATSWLRRRIPAVMTYVDALSAEAPVATLPAPGPGISYVLERLVVTGDEDFGLLIGTSAELSSLVEYVPATGVTMTQSDPQPWRLGPSDSLMVLWFVTPTAPNVPAMTVQARVEMSG